MAGPQDVIQLPVRFLDPNDREGFALAVQRNFMEIERYLSLLQMYVKQATGGAVKDLPASAAIWDRANNITAEGKWLTSKLQGAIDTALNQVNAGAGSVTVTDNNGIMIVDNPTNPTKALRLLGGVFAIANSKKPDGTWDWRTFGTGDGFVADLITSGKILTSLVNIVGDKYFTKILGDGFRVYDKNGSLAGHFGWYETLADQTASFSRNSIAYKQDGTQVLANQPRFEYVALPSPVWQDTFDTDQLATQYTQYNEPGGSASWVVSGGVLYNTNTGSGAGYLVKNDLYLQDCVIVINSDQMYRGGLLARFQDVNNLYLLQLHDDSGANPAQNLEIWKRVNGTWTLLAYADVAWSRGTSKEIRFVCVGSLLEAWFSGVKVLSVNDTSFAGGMVGFRCPANFSTPNKYLDFTVYYAQQGVMVEEGTTNLLTANQSSVETDLAGFIAYGSVISRDISEYYHGSASLKVVTNNSGAWEGFLIDKINASPNLPYSLQMRLKGSGTIGIEFRAFDAAGQHLGSKWHSGPVTLTSAWQLVKIENFVTPSNTAWLDVYIYTPSQQAATIYYDCGQIEQKAYATSWTLGGSTRAPEALTIPTAGVFQNGNWTVKLRYTPTSATNLGSQDKYLWNCYIDSNNQYDILVGWGGELILRVKSGGTWYQVAGSSTTVGNTYFITASGDGSKLRLFVNGVQIGTDTAYVEPVGTLPANMYIGSKFSGDLQANGIISDFAVMSRAQTLAEHQAEYNTGLPLVVDENTTYLMSCNGTLQPTVRRFGLKMVNGVIEADALFVNRSAGAAVDMMDGFGDGSDGVFNSTGNVTITIPTEDAYSVIKQYESFTLNAGHTLTTDKRCRGLFIFCRGDVVINGTIDMSGKAAKVSKANSAQRILQIPVGTYTLDIPSGGAAGNGGNGGNAAYPPTYGGYGGAGSNGSPATWFGGGIGGAGGGGGGGNGYSGAGGSGNAGGISDLDSPLGTSSDQNFCGGRGGNSSSYGSFSGGGGGGGGAGYVGGAGGTGYRAGSPGASGGGFGGGLVVIIAKGNVTIGSTGRIVANGLNGGAGGKGGDAYGSSSYGGGGGGGGQGGGGGGVVVIAYRGTFTNNGSIQVNGGTGGAGGAGGTAPSSSYYGSAGSSGTAGTVGTIVIAQV